MNPHHLLGIASLCAACSSSLGGAPDTTLDRPPGMDTISVDREASEESVSPVDIGPDHEDAGHDALQADATDVAHDAEVTLDANARDADGSDAEATDVQQDVPQDRLGCFGTVDSYFRSCFHCASADTLVTVACQRPDFQRCHIYSVDCVDDDFVQCWRESENPRLAEGCRAFCARARDAGVTSCTFQ